MKRTRMLAAVLGALTASLVLAPAASAAPGPPDAPEWWFDTWHVPSLWAAGADGRGITVAVVDTGVAGGIPELAGKVLPGTDFLGNGSDGRTDYDVEPFSHGTAMASIIAAGRGSFGIEGLAPAAKILPVAVPLKGVVSSGTLNPDATAASVRYSADHGARVISMSLGGIRIEGQDDLPCPKLLQDAVIYALNKGSLVVAASGNSGDSGSPVEEPGVCLGVVSVGSVNQALQVSAFSSRHPYLTFTAPGDQIPSLSRQAGQAYVGGGTSQATAITSAAIALVWSRYPTESNREILDRMLASAVDRGPKGRDPAYGLGVINPQAAIGATVAPNAANVVFDGVRPLRALAAAKPKSLATKPPAGDENTPIGSVEVGQIRTSPSTWSYVLAGFAVGFFLLALLLAVLAIRRRPNRRGVRRALTPGALPG